MKEVQQFTHQAISQTLLPEGQLSSHIPGAMRSYATLGGDTVIGSIDTPPTREARADGPRFPKHRLPPGTNYYVPYDETAAVVNGQPQLVSRFLEADDEAQAEATRQADENKLEWMRHNRKDRKCLIAEALVGALIVIGIVLGAVLGTQLSRHDDTSRKINSAIVPTEETVPVGKRYNSSITIGGNNCSTSAACGGSLGGPNDYTVGVSQNLYGDGMSSSAWSCGTCWQLKVNKDGDGLPVNLASAIVVVAVNNCPATPGNDNCIMKNLEDTNVHGTNVNFNLCPDSGPSLGLFGSLTTQLGIGTAIRVEC